MAKKRADGGRKHPLFGLIPFVPHPEQEGIVVYDPDYEPPMPRGAVRGDIRRQDHCPMCHVPANRPAKARACFRRFVAETAESRGLKPLLRYAEQWLAAE